MTFQKIFLLVGTAGAALAVVLGAFGAHGLKGSLSEALLNAYQTGVQYQFYHSLALLLVAILLRQGLEGTWILVSGALFIAGLLFFSGSLYALALGGPRWLGPITPLGGLMFIAAWCSLFIAVLRNS
ncbi:Uncharacterized membrane protein YgdD, TMEM256/DUF423 family [Alteromonadaceae bacterium Bs31]|nr:Uncharacterized membrane protein YgdD, TMEM256/DUF423 family [Alteromonadaceae bacterium Bs31]